MVGGVDFGLRVDIANYLLEERKALDEAADELGF